MNLIILGLKILGLTIYCGIQITYGVNHLVRLQGLAVALMGAGWIYSDIIGV